MKISNGVKKYILFSIIFFGVLFFAKDSWAATYYVKTDGNDLADGLSDANAWKTIAKVNSFWASYVSGDSILFKRGNAWTTGTSQSLRIRASGSSGGGYITFGAYGTGAKPIISHDSSVDSLGVIYGYEDNLSYIRIENLDLRAVGTSTAGGISFSRTGMSYISIVDCDVTDEGDNGNGIWTDPHSLTAFGWN